MFSSIYVFSVISTGELGCCSNSRPNILIIYDATYLKKYESVSSKKASASNKQTGVKLDVKWGLQPMIISVTD